MYRNRVANRSYVYNKKKEKRKSSMVDIIGKKKKKSQWTVRSEQTKNIVALNIHTFSFDL